MYKITKLWKHFEKKNYKKISNSLVYLEPAQLHLDAGPGTFQDGGRLLLAGGPHVRLVHLQDLVALHQAPVTLRDATLHLTGEGHAYDYFSNKYFMY